MALSESKAQVLDSGMHGTWRFEICERAALTMAGIGEENSLGPEKEWKRGSLASAGTRDEELYKLCWD